MIQLFDHTRRLAEEYIKQDFYPVTRRNGDVIYVSMDGEFFYYPER